jgi:hypothetical protein
MSTEHVLLEGYCGTVRWRLTFDLYDFALPFGIWSDFAIWSEVSSYIFNFSFLCFSVSAARVREVPMRGE